MAVVDVPVGTFQVDLSDALVVQPWRCHSRRPRTRPCRLRCANRTDAWSANNTRTTPNSKFCAASNHVLFITPPRPDALLRRAAGTCWSVKRRRKPLHGRWPSRGADFCRVRGTLRSVRGVARRVARSGEISLAHSLMENSARSTSRSSGAQSSPSRVAAWSLEGIYRVQTTERQAYFSTRIIHGSAATGRLRTYQTQLLPWSSPVFDRT